MIPKAYITEWRANAPWADDAQVEQDLVLSRVLVETFGDAERRRHLVLRGGTALNKLYLDRPTRYSEDIDLVQVEAGPIEPIVNPLQSRLEAFLGPSSFQTRANGVRVLFRFDSEIPPVVPLRLKVEVNTREPFSVLPLETRTLVVGSRWFSGSAEIRTYHLDELIGTKMRALYQRNQSRDLYDLWMVVDRGLVDPERVVECFLAYLDHEGLRVSRAEYEENLTNKLADRHFMRDIEPLLIRPVERPGDSIPISPVRAHCRAGATLAAARASPNPIMCRGAHPSSNARKPNCGADGVRQLHRPVRPHAR